MNLPNANTCCSQQQIFYRTLYECNNTVGSFFLLTRFYLSCVLLQEKKNVLFYSEFLTILFDYSIFVVIAVQFLTIESINKHTKNDWWIFEVDTFFSLCLYADHQPTTTKTTTKDPNKSVHPTPNYNRFFVLFYFSFCAKSTRSVSNTNRQKKNVL